MERDLDLISRRQFGVFSRDQALASGLADHQIKYRLRTRAWEEVEICVYRRASTPETWHGQVMAACLAARGAASHHTAAALHGILNRFEGLVEVTGPRTRYYRRTHARVHWLTDLDFDADVESTNGIPTTTMVRTLIDLASVAPAGRVEVAFNRALNRGLELPALLIRMDELDRHGKWGIRKLRRVLLLHDVGQPASDSDWETMLLQLIRRAGLPTPVRQHTVRLPDRNVEIDLAYPAEKIAIEYDGVEPHSGRRALARDDARQNLLVLDGYLVLRFTKDQVRYYADDVAAKVAAALALRGSRGA